MTCPFCGWDCPKNATQCGGCLEDLPQPEAPKILRELMRATADSNRRIREMRGPVGILGIFGVRTNTG